MSYSASTLNLSLGTNSGSISGTGLKLSIGTFLTVTGDFGFQEATANNITTLDVAAENVNATMTAGPASLNVSGASLGLLVVTASPGTPAVGTVLSANGGTDTLTGVPGLSLTASGMQVLANDTGVDPTTLPGATTGIATPDGSLTLGFTGFGSGGLLQEVEGTVALTIGTTAVPNLISVSGSFLFQDITPSGGTQELLIGATNVDASLGTGTTNLSISSGTQIASLALLIVPGGNAASTTFALNASGGTDSLNGVPGVTLTSNNLSVEANTGVSQAAITAATTAASGTVLTPTGSFALSLPAANVVEISGTVTLNFNNFVSLTGSFAFTEQPDPSTAGVTDILIGASNVMAFIGASNASGTPTVGIEITNAQLGLVVYTSSSSTTFALTATATITPVGLPADINLTGTVTLAINNTGAAVNQTISTPAGTAINVLFADGTNVQTVSGTVTLSIGSRSQRVLVDGHVYFQPNGDQRDERIVDWRQRGQRLRADTGRRRRFRQRQQRHAGLGAFHQHFHFHADQRRIRPDCFRDGVRWFDRRDFSQRHINAPAQYHRERRECHRWRGERCVRLK